MGGRRTQAGVGGAPGGWVGGTGLCRTWESTESSPGGPTLPTGLEHPFFGIHSSYRRGVKGSGSQGSSVPTSWLVTIEVRMVIAIIIAVGHSGQTDVYLVLFFEVIHLILTTPHGRETER